MLATSWLVERQSFNDFQLADVPHVKFDVVFPQNRKELCLEGLFPMMLSLIGNVVGIRPAIRDEWLAFGILCCKRCGTANW